MGFLAGSLGFERFRVSGAKVKQFGPEHIKLLNRFAIGKVESSSAEATTVGFLAGGHLFDQDFSLEKNVVNDSLHCGLRIDTNKIPSALRKAWLAMELAPLIDANPGKRISKAERQEAKDAVEARCEEEAASGKFKRMQQFSALWDGRDGVLYLGSSSAVAIELGCDLFHRAFDLKLEHITSGKIAHYWAKETKKLAALDKVEPTVFHADEPGAHPAWLVGDSTGLEYLGNEFLLWLWWTLETQSDTLTLDDDSEVIAMLNRTLTLECPRGDSGKESILAEAPVRLPEAHHAIKTGKLPRKSGMILVRHGVQYEFVLQAETFGVSGGRIKLLEENEDAGPRHEARVDGLRDLAETIDLLFALFCERRLNKAWQDDVKKMRGWLKRDAAKAKNPAA